MKQYRCIKSFSVPFYDGDGWLEDENKMLPVVEGSVWERDDSCDIIGGDIHLENRETGDWLEIDKTTLKENFSTINE